MSSIKKYIFFILISGLYSNLSLSQNTNPLDSIMSELFMDFPEIAKTPDAFEIQILYTQINPIDSILSFETFDYNLDTNKYFYPASTVKMPVAFLALEKLERLQREGFNLNLDTPIKFDAKHASESSFDTIRDNHTSQPATIRKLIQQVFSVSDNNAYNRLFEFLGRDSINLKLKEKGIFENSKITHRVGVSGFDHSTNAYANPYYFYSGLDTIYSEEMRSSQIDFLESELTHTHKGKGFYIDSDSTDMRPFDMSEKNFVNLIDLQNSIHHILFPTSVSSSKRFKINEKHRDFLIQSMARLPREYQFPTYDSIEYYDSYGKFFLFGDSKQNIPDHIRIFNKVGYAYGTLTDCSFIVDFKNEIAFFLSATILVNENQIFNDGNYEYDEIGIPFLAALGQKIYDFELKRDSKPLDLRAFDINFSEELDINYIHSK